MAKEDEENPLLNFKYLFDTKEDRISTIQSRSNYTTDEELTLEIGMNVRSSGDKDIHG